MAIKNTLTIPNLGYVIRFGQVTLAGTPGTATETDAFADIDDTGSAVTLGRATPGGTLGNLAHSASGDDLVIDSNANETSTVDYVIIGLSN